LLPNPAVQLLVRTVRGLGSHDASHMAAGVAYYAILSLFPLLLGMIAVMGWILPSQDVQAELFDFFRQNLPGLVDVLESNIEDVIRVRGALGVMSILLLFWTASAMFGAVGRAINRAFGIRKSRPFYVSKLRDLSMALGVGLLFLLSLAASSVFTFLGKTDLAAANTAAELGARLLGFLLNFPVLLLMYKFLPNAEVSWRYVWPGAFLAAVLLEIAKTAFIFYMGNIANYESVYGSVGSLIALLVWIYLSAFIIVIGAEFSSQYGDMRQEANRDVASDAVPTQDNGDEAEPRTC
jgi:membrane protein